MAAYECQQARFSKKFLPALLGPLFLALGGCAVAETPAAPAGNPHLEQGQAVYASACRSCHGATGGGGGSTPALNNGIVDRFPDKADQVAVVADGRGGMPGYSDRLSDEEISAVVDYIREVLDEGA